MASVDLKNHMNLYINAQTACVVRDCGVVRKMRVRLELRWLVINCQHFPVTAGDVRIGF